MTLLQELVDGASGDQTPVATLLRKAKVLAARLGTVQLEEWVEHELNGYPDAATLPEYRGPFEAEVQGNFGGVFGSGLENAPIPSASFPKEYREGALFNFEFRQPVAELESLASTNDVLHGAWPANAIYVTNYLMKRGEVHLYEGMGLQQAWRLISPNQLKALVDTVRNRILDLALSIEAIAPDAGQLGAEAPDPARIHQIVANVYGGAANIAVASSNVDQSITIPVPESRESLIAALRDFGITEEEAAELEVALNEEGDVQAGELGPKTSSWLGRVIARLTSAGVNVMSGAGGVLVAQVITNYLSGPRAR